MSFPVRATVHSAVPPAIKPESATDFLGGGLMSVISISLIVTGGALDRNRSGGAPVEDAVRRCAAEEFWIDRKSEVGQFARLQRDQPFDRCDEAILLSHADHAFRQVTEFPDVVRPLERAGAERMRVRQCNFVADDGAALQLHD